MAYLVPLLKDVSPHVGQADRTTDARGENTEHPRAPFGVLRQPENREGADDGIVCDQQRDGGHRQVAQELSVLAGRIEDHAFKFNVVYSATVTAPPPPTTTDDERGREGARSANDGERLGAR